MTDLGHGTETPGDMLTPEQIADELQIAKSTALRLIRGEMRHVSSVNRRVIRVPRAWFVEWIEQATVAPTTSANDSGDFNPNF